MPKTNTLSKVLPSNLSDGNVATKECVNGQGDRRFIPFVTLGEAESSERSYWQVAESGGAGLTLRCIGPKKASKSESLRKCESGR